MDLEERQLVSEAAAGSKAAGDELFGRHWRSAWRLAFSVTGDATTADDVAQEAFEKAFRGLPRFNGRSSFRTWLFRIVLNSAIDADRRHRPADRLETANLPPFRLDGDVVVAQEVFEAVFALPLERRTVVVLRYWARHSPPEIAEMLAIPVGTVHSRLARALADLRTQLEVNDVARP